MDVNLKDPLQKYPHHNFLLKRYKPKFPTVKQSMKHIHQQRSKTSLFIVEEMYLALHVRVQMTADCVASLQRHSLLTCAGLCCCRDTLKYGMNISNLNKLGKKKM